MELLDEHSAARYLGGKKPLSVRTVQRMRFEGKGPRFIKVGAAVRYAKDDLPTNFGRSSSNKHERDRSRLAKRRPRGAALAFRGGRVAGLGPVNQWPLGARFPLRSCLLRSSDGSVRIS